jgi:hypothetical protein
MSSKKFKGELTISKVHATFCDDYIEISLKDSKAVAMVLVAQMSLEEFAKAITGQGLIEIEAEAFDTYEKLGKKRIVEPFYFDLPDLNYKDRKAKASEHVAKLNSQNDGWEYSSYFGSQRSFIPLTNNNMTRCITSRFKWVDDDS